MSIPGTFDQWVRAIKQIGLPSVVCCILLCAVWPLFQEQGEIMRAARISIERNTETSACTSEAIAKLTFCQQQQGEMLSRICRVLESIEPALKSKLIASPPPNRAHPEPELQ